MLSEFRQKNRFSSKLILRKLNFSAQIVYVIYNIYKRLKVLIHIPCVYVCNPIPLKMTSASFTDFLKSDNLLMVNITIKTIKLNNNNYTLFYYYRFAVD